MQQITTFAEELHDLAERLRLAGEERRDAAELRAARQDTRQLALLFPLMGRMGARALRSRIAASMLQ